MLEAIGMVEAAAGIELTWSSSTITESGTIFATSRIFEKLA